MGNHSGPSIDKTGTIARHAEADVSSQRAQEQVAELAGGLRTFLAASAAPESEHLAEPMAWLLAGLVAEGDIDAALLDPALMRRGVRANVAQTAAWRSARLS